MIFGSDATRGAGLSPWPTRLRPAGFRRDQLIPGGRPTWTPDHAESSAFPGAHSNAYERINFHSVLIVRRIPAGAIVAHACGPGGAQ